VVGLSAQRVEQAVDYLCRAGFAELDDERARVGLTRLGIEQLVGR